MICFGCISVNILHKDDRNNNNNNKNKPGQLSRCDPKLLIHFVLQIDIDMYFTITQSCTAYDVITQAANFGLVLSQHRALSLDTHFLEYRILHTPI